MIKPPMPGMSDTLEFVKNLWGGMQIPGMSGMPGMPAMPAPALSIEELDKKIADLKAVEAWLTLNQNMLHGTIQAMEIQRGTLATLRAMGDSMAQAMNQSNAAGDAAMAPFAQFFSQTAQKNAPGASAAQAPNTPPPAPETAANPQAGAEAPNAAMPAAVAWWNLLQDQFRQAVASAMPADGSGPDKPDERSPAPSHAAGSPADVSGGAAQAEPSGNPEQQAGARGEQAGARRGARSKADKA